ncbi:uncharacterized protein SCODWIG_00678 [Saccharomycodes ludwigii]|uniref:Nucleoporin NUP188 n=1 Tax=Saccharomycodes ludwigii TaxID=36035 RepID=A0A376B2M2_9ASCO|nr:uncharacterized protein SCODWIG_00678 [Saccharomycodes ludwigii]
MVSFTSIYNKLRYSNGNISADFKTQYLEPESSILLKLIELNTTSSINHTEGSPNKDIVQLANVISKSLDVNAERCLSIIKELNIRFSQKYEKCSNIDFYKEHILIERNNIINTLLFLLNNGEKKYLDLVFNNRLTLFDEILTLLENKFMKSNNHYDTTYCIKLLKLLTFIILNYDDLPLDKVVMWLENIVSLAGNLATSQLVQSLIIVNTLLMLGLNTKTNSINIDLQIFSDRKQLNKLNTTILNNQSIMESQPVLVYYWSFVLYCIQFISTDSSNPLKYNVHELAYIAESSNVFQELGKLAESFKFDKFYMVIMITYLKIMSYYVPMNATVAKCVSTFLNYSPSEIVESYLIDKDFESQMVILRQKFPLINDGLFPFMYLGSTNSDFSNFELRHCNTYATKIKLSSFAYDLVEDSSTVIILKKDLLVVPPLELNPDVLLPIPEGTIGKIVPTSMSKEGDDDSDTVVIFMYDYNGWSLLGSIIQNLQTMYLSIDDHNRQFLISIIDLLTKNIATSIERATDILQETSAFITNEEDVVSVIFKIFEQALQKNDLDILCGCTRLMCSLLPNFSHLVWSHLVKSSLLDKGGQTLSNALNHELIYREYGFTSVLIELVKELFKDSLRVITEFSVRTKNEILEKLIIHLIHTYESYQYWEFKELRYRFRLGSSLATLFYNILCNVYSTRSTEIPCSNVIIDAFLQSNSPDVRPVNSLIKLLKLDESALEESTELYKSMVFNNFKLANVLVQIRPMLNFPPSTLEMKIFQNADDIFKVYALHYDLRCSVIDLFTSVVQAPWSKGNIEPPSLLSFLNSYDSFIASISYDIQLEPRDIPFSKSVYQFFSKVMESTQGGLKVLLLTGSKSQEGSSLKINEKSLLSILKKQALDIDTLSISAATNLLTAIISALNVWPESNLNTSNDLLIDKLIDKLQKFELAGDDTADKYRLVSKIAEYCSFNLFTSNFTPFKKLFDSPAFPALVSKILVLDNKNWTDNAILSPFKMQQLFNENWTHLRLEPFLMEDNTYNIKLLDQVLDQDPKWKQDIRGKVVAASLEMHYFACQLAAAKSVGALITSYIRKTTVPLNDYFIEVVQLLLEFNKKSTLPELSLERLELVFYILYSFFKTKKNMPEGALTKFLCELIDIPRTKEIGDHDNDMLDDLVNSTNRNYYRSTLRSILLIFSMAPATPRFIDRIDEELLVFFEEVFAKGTALLCTKILVQVTKTTDLKEDCFYDKIQDLMLLLALFNKVRELNPPLSFNMKLADILSNSSMLKTIVNLYSSSHLLKSKNNEAVLADVSLTFILELCHSEPVSEKLIMSGLFPVILESPISVAIQKGNLTGGKLYDIWCNGLLSIVLKLLSQFGSKVVNECCLFAKYFNNQITFAINSWSDYKNLTVSTAFIQETGQIILFYKMMNILNSHVTLPGLNTDDQRQDLYNAFANFLTHPKFLNSRLVATNSEEQKKLDTSESRALFLKQIVEQIRELQDFIYSTEI